MSRVRLTLAAILLLSLCFPACAQFTGTTSVCQSVPPASCNGIVPVGNLIIATLNFYQSSSTPATGSMTNTHGYTWLTAINSTGIVPAGLNYRTYQFYAISTDASNDSFFPAISGSFSNDDFYVNYVTGTPNTVPLEVSKAADSFTTNTNPQVGSNITTTVAGDIIISSVACAAGFNGWSVGTGYTNLNSSGGQAFRQEFKIAGAPGSYNATFGQASSCSFGTSTGIQLTFAFKPLSAAQNARHSTIISFDPHHHHRIPWDDRRRKLEIVRI